MLTTTYELDIVPGGVPQVITASQYDANSRSLAFNLYSSTGNLSLPSGTQAAIRGTKPDGNGFDYNATITGTTVTFTITEQMTAIAGRVMCEVYLYSGTAGSTSYKQIATANFILYVERAAMDKDTLISGSEIRQLVDIMDNSGEIIAAASLAATSAANAAQSAIDAAGTLAAATTTIHNERDAAISAVNTSKTAAIEEAETAYEQQLESLLAVKSDADETVAAMQASTAPLFDETSTYNAGDYCIYNADLYRCIAPELTAGAWDASHWERTTFSDELSDMGAEVFDALHYATVSGNPLEITGTLNTLPARQVDIDIAPIQDLHGCSYPWPAGYGSNLWPEYTTETKSGITLTNDGGKVTLNGTASADTWFDINVSYAVAANQYIHIGAFNPAVSTNRLSIFVITSAGNPQINLNTINASTSDTSASERTITRLRLRVPSGETYTDFVLYPYVQIGGDAPASWTPYANICPIEGTTSAMLTVKPDASSAGTAYTIAFPSAAGTVYGGTLDVTNGILKVTWARDTFTWGTYKGTTTSGDYIRRLFYLNSTPNYDSIKSALCSIGPFSNTSTYNPPHFRCVRNGSRDYCYIYMPSTTDDSTTIQVAYPLATPIAYSVTAHEIHMLEDYTLLTTDAASITAEVYVNQVDYSTGYTDNAITNAESEIIAAAYADTTYAVGDYCLYEGHLYRCTTDIATPEAWTAAHWEQVTVSDELQSISDDLTDFHAQYDEVNGSTYETVGPDNPITYDDCVSGTEIKNVIVQIEPEQAGSGTPGPDNIRTISGITGDVSLTRMGGNILPGFTAQTKTGVTVAVADDGTVTLTGTATEDTFFDVPMNITIHAGQSWTLSAFNAEAATSSALTLFVINDHTSELNNAQLNLDKINVANVYSGKSITHKLTTMRLRVPSGYDLGSGFTLRPMATLGGMLPETYISPNTQAVTFTMPAAPSAVDAMFGTYDATTGILTVDRVLQSFTLSEYSARNSYGDYYRYRFTLYTSCDTSKSASYMCSIAPYYPSTTSRTVHFTVSSRIYLYVFLPKNIPDTTQVQFAYPLVTPLAYDIGATAALTCADDQTILNTSAATLTADFPASKLRRYIHEQDAIPVTSEGIEDGAVTPEKTTFFEVSSFNMINPLKIDTGLYYSGSGRLTEAQESTAFAFAGLIPVKEGRTYTLSGTAARFNVGGYFDVNASAETGQTSVASITFVAPVTGDGMCFTVPVDMGIAYVGFNLGKDTETQEIAGDFQLEAGEMATEIVNYEEVTTIKPEYLPQTSSGGTTTLTGLDTLPRPSYAHMQDRISNFRAHWLAKDKDLVVCGTGTSLTARSSEMCTVRADATSRPPLLHSDNFASKIWDRIAWDGQQYRRFDYTGFFTETGTWSTATNGISDWDDYTYRYGITRYASGPASIAFTVPTDAWQFNFIYRTDTTGATATVSIAEGNGKMQVWNGSAWVEANQYTFSMLETPTTLTDITIYNPNTSSNTKSITRTSYQVGGNTTYQRRLKMRCKGGSMDSRASTKTVTISATTGRMMYWGVEWSPREYMITYINAARGSHNMTAYEQDNANDHLALSHYQDNEIWSFKPDLIFSEIPIHNSGAGGSSGTRFYYVTEYWGNAAYDFFLNADNSVSLAARAAANGVTDVEWVLFNGSLTKNFGCFTDTGGLKLLTDNTGAVYTCMDAQGLCYKWLVENRDDVIAINACKYWIDAARTMFDGDLNAATAASGADGATFSNEGSHWNNLGGAVMARCIGGVFDFYN